MSKFTNSSPFVRTSLNMVLADLAEIVHAGAARSAGPQLRALVQEAFREETYAPPVKLHASQYGATA